MDPDKKQKEIDRINIFLEKYTEANDRKPYRFGLARLDGYLYEGSHTDEERLRWL